MLAQTGLQACLISGKDNQLWRVEENQTPLIDFDLPGAFSQLKLKELLP